MKLWMNSSSRSNHEEQLTTDKKKTENETPEAYA